MSGSGESSSTYLQQQQPQQQQQKGRERRKAIIERNCCQGGFCELVLPGTSDDSSSSSTSNNYSSSGSRSSNKDMLKSLSKRERRLQKSRERDSAIRLLKWVLTEEEYSALEETGDLVRLKVKECPGDANVVTATTANTVTTTNKCNNAAAVGCWIDGASVILAKREHRPVLARLAYVEFQSSQSMEAYSNNSTTDEGGGDDMANFKMFNDSCEPCAVTEPSYAGNDSDVIVCRICYNVYNLLGQARGFLASIHAEEAERHNSIQAALGVGIDEKEDKEQDNNACNNQPPENETAAGNSDAIVEGGDVPPNLLTRSSSEGPNSPKWTTSSTTMLAKEPLTRSATFHGPISPSNASESKKSKRKAKRKERDRKQMEENAKIFILVAESDEVSRSWTFILSVIFVSSFDT